MQREKSIKAKEVIEALIKFMSALEVEYVPCAETFRRAKFNKQDVVQKLWDVLRVILVKAVVLECKCQHSDPGAQARFVRSALWHCGYGARWVVPTQAGSGYGGDRGGGVGSRELLLAFGWMLSSGSLLEYLLGERVLQLQPLALPPAQVCSPGSPLMDLWECGKGREDGAAGARDGAGGSSTSGSGSGSVDLRHLQWEYGKLRHRWRALLSAQDERAKLIHKVLSDMGSQPASQPPSAQVQAAGTGTGDASPLSKEMEKTRRLNQLLEAYLQWKLLEPLFWRWMESVIDSHTAASCVEMEEDSSAHATTPAPQGPWMPIAVTTTSAAAQACCSSGDWVSRRLQRLEALRLQTQSALRATRDGSASRHGAGRQHKANLTGSDADPVNLREAEREVTSRLQGLSINTTTTTPTSIENGFIPCLHLQGHPAPHPIHQPSKHTPHGAGPSGKLQASEVIQELRAREVHLVRELEEARRAQRTALKDQANGLEGVILVPPPKRCHTPP
ncbi:tubulin epsilon and delta complex protein 1 [Engraulis encrasicolus]|uniref:tubulin epsilon and delta complex protein 1 n=1 Tax=Engraulis encrasicolus TaxID=184585 RepID=UPI002FCF6D60